MKPIGSITNIYPFIEPDEILLIQSITADARDYADFADRLRSWVISYDASDVLLYVAWYHTYSSFNARQFRSILEKYSEQPLLRPWFIWWEMTVQESWEWNILQNAVKNAISATSNPWILYDLYSLQLSCTHSEGAGIIAEDKVIKKMEDLIDDNESLEFTRSRISSHLAERYRNQDNVKALELWESTYTHTKTHGEVVFGTTAMVGIAEITSLTEPTKGLDLLQSVADTDKKLGFFDRWTGLFTVMGVVLDARGEYDAAVRSYEESLQRREMSHPGQSQRFIPTCLSRAFRRMGLYEEALEWARMALAQEPILSRIPAQGLTVTASINMSAALALLGRIEEAKEYCETANQMTLKVGSELWLSDTYFCTGLIERSEGNLIDAMANFERAFEIIERLERQGRINECLLVLAETEIQLNHEKRKGPIDQSASHWLNLAEEMARRKDLPGVLGQVLLLKAKIELLQSDFGSAEIILNQVRDLSEKPGSRFLQQKMTSLKTTFKDKY
jgi:tetratricopeptide (TPR) repeat protein